MARKKVKLAFISNDSARKTTFRKRNKGLIKKVHEISTLCGIAACAIIYSPYDSNPEVWPSNSGVQRVVSDFRALPEMEQNKKMVDQESFLGQSITKASENLKKQRKENRELEMTQVMFQCLLGNIEMFKMNAMDLNDLSYMIDQHLRDVNRRIEIFQNSGMEVGESSNDVVAVSEGIETMAIVPATSSPIGTITEGSSSSSVVVEAKFLNNIQQQQHQQPIRHQGTPTIGRYEQSHNQYQNQNRQQWFTGMMNRSEPMSYATGQMQFPVLNNHHYNRNHHHHHQPQPQQIRGESSNTPAIANSSNITPHYWSESYK